MILEPVAKPVRIRVILRGNVCLSLQDIRDNFSLGELFQMYHDHRLERWLSQMGESELSEKLKLSLINNTDDYESVINLMSIIFDADLSDTNILIEV